MTPTDLPFRSMEHQIPSSKQDAAQQESRGTPSLKRNSGGTCRKPGDPRAHKAPFSSRQGSPSQPFLAPPKSRGLASTSVSFHCHKLPPDGTKVETALSGGYFKVLMGLGLFCCGLVFFSQVSLFVSFFVSDMIINEIDK